MDASEFLFPTDLQVTPTNIQNVLVIGSCQAEFYVREFKRMNPKTHFDYIAFHNLSELPQNPPLKVQQYDYQYIQLSLRAVVSDRIVNFQKYCSESYNQEIIDSAIQSCELMLKAALKYNISNKITTFVSNFCTPQTPVPAALREQGSLKDFNSLVKILNAFLCEIVGRYENVYIADIDSIGNSMGKRYFLDDFLAFYSHAAVWTPTYHVYDSFADKNGNSITRIEPLAPITDTYESQLNQYSRAVWKQQETLFRIINQIDMVKLVIFDLDDTMWRGQIGEHYDDNTTWPVIHGWPLGIWEAVHHLRARGILTAICSKNSEEMVRSRWERGIRENWINLDDFVAKEINWNTKAENIFKIMQQVSLTPKSVVFVDDNPVEREAVKAAFPEIRVIGSNPFTTRRTLLWSSETQIVSRTKETINREMMVRKQQEREKERLSLTREEFLKKLNCSVRLNEISSTDSDKFTRSIELLNKTNQFNTTGQKRNIQEMAEYFKDGGKLYVFEVEDKFTIYGLVGVILFKNGYYEQFAMSCRVIGLDIETSIINAIMKREREIYKIDKFYGRIIETKSNTACKEIFQKCQFEESSTEPGLYNYMKKEVEESAMHLNIKMIA
jgi:FkbH-like protein